MIAGLALPELAAKIVTDARAKRDFKASTATLVATNAGTITLATKDEQFALTPTPFALRQIGEHAGIPAKYVDRMAAEAPGLLAANINHWFTKSGVKPRPLGRGYKPPTGTALGSFEHSKRMLYLV